MPAVKAAEGSRVCRRSDIFVLAGKHIDAFASSSDYERLGFFTGEYDILKRLSVGGFELSVTGTKKCKA